MSATARQMTASGDAPFTFRREKLEDGGERRELRQRLSSCVCRTSQKRKRGTVPAPAGLHTQETEKTEILICKVHFFLSLTSRQKTEITVWLLQTAAEHLRSQPQSPLPGCRIKLRRGQMFPDLLLQKNVCRKVSCENTPTNVSVKQPKRT